MQQQRQGQIPSGINPLASPAMSQTAQAQALQAQQAVCGCKIDSIYTLDIILVSCDKAEVFTFTFGTSDDQALWAVRWK